MGSNQNWRSLTRGIGVTTTVGTQPGRRFEGEFLLPVSDLETKLSGGFEASFDAFLKLRQVR